MFGCLCVRLIAWLRVFPFVRACGIACLCAWLRLIVCLLGYLFTSCVFGCPLVCLSLLSVRVGLFEFVCVFCLIGGLFVCLFACMSAELFACYLVCPSVGLSVCMSVFLYVCLSVCLSVRPSVCLSVCLCVCLSVCCLLYTSPSPRDMRRSRMPSSA